MYASDADKHHHARYDRGMDPAPNPRWTTIVVRLFGCVMTAVGVMTFFVDALFAHGTMLMCVAGILVVALGSIIIAANPRDK